MVTSGYFLLLLVPRFSNNVCSKRLYCILVFFFIYIYIIYSIRSIRKQHFFTNSEAATGDVLWEKVFLEISQNSQEDTCQRLKKVAGLRPAVLLKNSHLAQVFSTEFCEISKNTFFTEQLRTTTSTNCETCFEFQISVKCYPKYK